MNNSQLTESFLGDFRCLHSIDTMLRMPSACLIPCENRTNHSSDGKIISVWFKRRIINSASLQLRKYAKKHRKSPSDTLPTVISHFKTTVWFFVFIFTTATVFPEFFSCAKISNNKKVSNGKPDNKYDALKNTRTYRPSTKADIVYVGIWKVWCHTRVEWKRMLRLTFSAIFKARTMPFSSVFSIKNIIDALKLINHRLLWNVIVYAKIEWILIYKKDCQEHFQLIKEKNW